MTRFVALPALIALTALALVGCATPSTEPAQSRSAPGSASCDQVGVVVDFGVLATPSISACVTAGVAGDVLAEAGVTTEGTVDYGDQVVCRVNDEPSPQETVIIDGQEPFVESCQTLNAAAYWALWVKTAADSEWEYAQEGVTTLELSAGQSVGLVYTPGTESTPPQH